MSFALGNVYKTIGIQNKLEEDSDYIKEIITCLERYMNSDFGSLCADDVSANLEAIKFDYRILGAYNTTYGKIYIITEADRSTTTIMFANEY